MLWLSFLVALSVNTVQKWFQPKSARLNTPFQTPDNLVAVISLKANKSIRQISVNVVFGEFVQRAPRGRIPPQFQKIWNDEEVVNIDTELVATSSARSVRNHS